MSAVVKSLRPRTRRRVRRESGSTDATLLELVQAIARHTSDEREIVATVLRLLRSGRVRLIGSFRGSRLGAD
jgi:hypothetical protein